MPTVESAELRWRKSSVCDPSECLEVAHQGDRILIRDSANSSGPVLDVHRDQWRTFVGSVTSDPVGSTPVSVIQ
jgi:hypothetical protein